MKKLFFLVSLLIFFASTGLLANKTSVEIKAPAEVKKGTEVTLVVNVFHNGNSQNHHTDWVFIKINGKEVKRWTFDKENLPSGGDFTLEFKYLVTEDLTIETEGHCNLHGSAGIKSTKIKTI
jgi:desulfoferrodoxin (superoxide reductase-like protein)